VDDQLIALPDVVKGRLQLGPLGVLPAGPVRKHLLQVLAVKLKDLVLVEAAHPYVADRLVSSLCWSHSIPGVSK
jgi:hypothetical protein